MTGLPEADADPIFRAVVRATPQPLMILSDDLRVQFANPAFYDCFQVAPDETEGRRIYDVGQAQWDAPELHCLLDEALKATDRVEGCRLRHETARGGLRLMLIAATRLEIEGRRDRILIGITDITELEGMRDFQEKIVDTVREGLLVLDRDLRIVKANASFCALFRARPEEAEGALLHELHGGDWDIPELRDLLEKSLAQTSGFDDYAVSRDFAAIGPREVTLSARRIDHLHYLLLSIRDVTGERRSEERQKALTGELQHRVKNILATVRALLRQTRRRSRSIDEFAEAFEGRVDTLFRVQDRLVRATGAGLTPGEIVRLELDAHGAREGEDYSVDGDGEALHAREAQALAMAIHELATNAVRHGALKQSPGRIEVVVRQVAPGDEQRVELRWSEHGVQLDGDLPQADGFGREMIERSLPYMLGGRAELAFREDGVECRIEFPSQRQ